MIQKQTMVKRLSVACMLALAVQVGTTGCSGSEAESEYSETDSAIIRGSAVSMEDARASGIVRVQSSSVCSGVIVTPEWILTAAHCLPNYDADGDGEMDPARTSGTQIIAGQQGDSQSQYRYATRVLRHPRATWGSTAGVDAALIQIAALDVSGITPGHFMPGSKAKTLALYPLPVESLVGRNVTVMGYGYGAGHYDTKTGGMIDGADFGTLKLGVNTVASTTDHSIDLESPSGNGYICLGDSGGPSFLDDWALDANTGAFVLRSRFLVGLHSSGYFDASYYSSTDASAPAFRDWVTSTITAYSNQIALQCTGTTCSTGPSVIPNLVHWAGLYAPNGTSATSCYYATVSYQTERGCDFLRTLGIDATGEGSISSHFCGPLPFSIDTDKSVLSRGITFSASHFTTAPQNHCSGSSGGWMACRGNGCSVCTGYTVGYPKYFVNHPMCSPNTACGTSTSVGAACNVNCPPPTSADL